MKIADLHCDLLAYLVDHPNFHPEARCTPEQLRRGGVNTQVMAVFTQTVHDSTKEALNQLKCLKLLPNDLNFPYSFENAAGLCEEDENLELGLQRLDQYCENYGIPFYISLTWKEENRFGGGNLSNVGLKPDGKELLKKMIDLRIPVDFSHCSDELAHDILNTLEELAPEHPVLASHSNFRSICQQQRNLPDWLAKELIRKKALIGMNFVRTFVGETAESLGDHIAYGIELGAQNCLCFGADFFYEGVVENLSGHPNGLFFSELSDSSSYPYALSVIQKKAGINPAFLEKLTFGNFEAYCNRLSNLSISSRIPTGKRSP